MCYCSCVFSSKNTPLSTGVNYRPVFWKKEQPVSFASITLLVLIYHEPVARIYDKQSTAFEPGRTHI